MSARRPRASRPRPRKSDAQRARALAILRDLEAAYPDPRCELDFSSPHELLIATILSAQSTDAGVNKATPALFAAFPTPGDYVRAGVEGVAPYLRTLNFWRMKAKAVVESMRAVEERFGGQVPRTMSELLTLRGVARKTANVVLGTAFGINEGVVVDTHVMRLARRFALSRAATPEAIEQDLMALFPRERWTDLSHMLILHGRRVCKSRGGLCAQDPICLKWCRAASAATKANATPPLRSPPIGSPSLRRRRSEAETGGSRDPRA